MLILFAESPEELAREVEEEIREERKRLRTRLTSEELRGVTTQGYIDDKQPRICKSSMKAGAA
jgi:hypothetical protein